MEVNDGANAGEKIHAQNSVDVEAVVHRTDFYFKISDREIAGFRDGTVNSVRRKRIEAEAVKLFKKDGLATANAGKGAKGVAGFTLDANDPDLTVFDDGRCGTGINKSVIETEGLATKDEVYGNKGQAVTRCQDEPRRIPTHLRSVMLRTALEVCRT